MALETGDFIPELDPNNPLGSDPKSAGDDHIRLLKRATQNSFGAFVGTIATPKSVTLTEDQINDAALKSEAQAISGAWQFDTPPLLSNAIALLGRDVADAVSHALLSLSAADIATIGNDDTDTELRALVNTDLLVGNVLSAAVVTLALGGLQVSDLTGSGRKAGFRNPRRILASADRAFLQSDEGAVVRVNGNNVDFTLDTLEDATTINLQVPLNTGCTIVNGTSAARWLDGSGAAGAGPLNIAEGSVVTLWWDAPGIVHIWGNGISN